MSSLQVVELGFQVVFPASPTRSDQEHLSLFTAAFEDADFMVGVATYPPERLSDPLAVLDSGERAALSRAAKPTNVQSEDLSIPFPDILCRRVTYEEDRQDHLLCVELRLCTSESRLYTLGVFDPTGGELTPTTREFFASFELIEPVVAGRRRRPPTAPFVKHSHPNLDLDSVPKTLNPLFGANLHRSDHRVGFLLNRVDGERTYAEIIEESGVEQDEAIEAFTTLLKAGLVANSWRDRSGGSD